MTGQYTKIIAVDYNTIQKNIAAVLGVGGTNPLTNATDATFGYNQSVLSSQVTVNAKMSSNQWSNLRTDILKARQHQTGLSETLVDPTVSEKITEAKNSADEQIAYTKKFADINAADIKSIDAKATAQEKQNAFKSKLNKISLSIAGLIFLPSLVWIAQS